MCPRHDASLRMTTCWWFCPFVSSNPKARPTCASRVEKARGGLSVRVRGQRSRHAKPHDRVPIVAAIPLARRGTQQPCGIDPCAAAIDAQAVVLGLVRAAVDGCSGVRFLVAILGPLPHVASHVVQAKTVRALRAGAMRVAAGVGFVPGVVVCTFGRIAPPESRRGAGTRRILPFGFARKAIGTFLLALLQRVPRLSV